MYQKNKYEFFFLNLKMHYMLFFKFLRLTNLQKIY